MEEDKMEKVDRVDIKCLEAKHLTDVEEQIKEVNVYLKETSTLITAINTELKIDIAVNEATEMMKVGHTRLVEMKLQLIDVTKTITELNNKLRVIRDEVE